MSRYLDPKSDVVFKRVFGDHPKLLKSFLNAVLPLAPGHEIVELTHLSPEHVPIIPVLRRTIADVQCTDQAGRVFIVEMQINWNNSFKQRLLFESGQAIVKQLEKGEDYHLLQPVYGLGLIGEAFDPEPSIWYHHYQLINVMKPTRDVIEHLQLVFVELPKLPVQSRDIKKLRLLWLRFMREIDHKTKEVDPELLSVPEIQQAVSLAEEAAYTPGELISYEQYWDQISREKTLLLGGHRDGLAQGLAQGRAEGILEAKLAMAQSLQNQNFPLELIKNVTKLSDQEWLTFIQSKNSL